MLAKDTKIIVRNRVFTPIQDIKNGDVVITKFDNEVITDVKSSIKNAFKFIFSDGYKVIVSESLYFLLPTQEWKCVTELNEGDFVYKPDNTYAKIVDITPLGKIEVYGFNSKNGVYLINGMYIR